MTKITLLPQDTAPTLTDSVATVDAETITTKRTLLSTISSLFFTQTNIPAGGGSPVTRDNESMFAYIASGGVWTADSAGVNRNASMTAMVCYINGRRISIAAVTARTFVATADTYIDVLDNGDGTGTLVYTLAINNAASPALAVNSLRNGIIVAGATTIAAATSINQGQETMLLPIASSRPYAVTDSLGNLIYPRDSTRRTLGMAQTPTALSTASTTVQASPILICPVIVPLGRKIKISAFAKDGFSSSASGYAELTIWDGVAGSGTQLQNATVGGMTANGQAPMTPFITTTPASISKTYAIGYRAVVAGTATIDAGATFPIQLLVELA